jgi:hypothetical protein
MKLAALLNSQDPEAAVKEPKTEEQSAWIVCENLSDNYKCEPCHKFKAANPKINYKVCSDCHHYRKCIQHRNKKSHICPFLDGKVFECKTAQLCPTNHKR